MNAEQESLAPSRPDEESGAKLFGDRDAEEVRLELLKDEAAVKTIGWLYLLAAIAFFMIWNAAFLSFLRQSANRPESLLEGIATVFYSDFLPLAILILLHILLGNGLRTLHNAARIGGVIYAGIVLFGSIGSIGCILLDPSRPSGLCGPR